MKTGFSCKFFLYLDSVFKNKHKLVHNPPQFEIGIVHFFSISISEEYTVFFTASSEGNESFEFAYFLIFLFSGISYMVTSITSICVSERVLIVTLSMSHIPMPSRRERFSPATFISPSMTKI